MTSARRELALISLSTMHVVASRWAMEAREGDTPTIGGRAVRWWCPEDYASVRFMPAMSPVCLRYVVVARNRSVRLRRLR